jgi:hypothetical protein
MSQFSATTTDTASWLDLLTGSISQVSGVASQAATQQLVSQLPSTQTMVTGYMGAIIAFWIVGGITLVLVNKFSR